MTARTLQFVSLLFALHSSTFADEKSLTVFGHRGMPLSYPEDTLIGFRKCWELGIAVELDIRRTKDGHLVILHDDTLDRTTTGTGKVGDMNLADVRKLDAGSKFGKMFTGEKVPELHEVFALLAKHPKPAMAIAVDLKIDDGKVEAEVVKAAKEAKVLDRLLFIGTTISDAKVRQRLRDADASAHVTCLADKPGDLAAALMDKHSDWAYVRFIPNAEQMRSIRESKKKVILVGPLVMKKELENWKKGIAAGIDAILTDYPVELQGMKK